MVEHRHWSMHVLPHLILGLGVLLVVFPVYLAFVGATLDPATIANGQMGVVPGNRFIENMSRVLLAGAGGSTREPVLHMLWNSFVMAMVIAIGKIVISILSAYAVVYFRFPLRKTAFWVIFMTCGWPESPGFCSVVSVSVSNT